MPDESVGRVFGRQSRASISIFCLGRRNRNYYFQDSSFNIGRDPQPDRFPAVDFRHDSLNTIGEFHLREVKDGTLPLGLQVLLAGVYFKYR